MKIVDNGNSILYWPQDDGPPASELLGFRVQKGSPWIKVEDNLVNRMVLGLEWRNLHTHVSVDPTGLYDFQVEDVMRMASMNILNANPMGLGKTVEGVRALKELGVENALLIVPKITISQWVAQLKTHWPESVDRLRPIYESSDMGPLERYAIYITNIHKLNNTAIYSKFKSNRWDVLAVDEAHIIKNRRAKLTAAVKSLPSGKRWALTGTPVLRLVDDLWSILHFLDPRYSGTSYWNFVNYFCNVQDDFWGRKITGLSHDPARVAVLRELLSYVSIRHDMLLGVGKVRETIQLDMSSAQRKLYRDIVQLMLDELPETLTIPNGAVSDLRLRQLCSWPGLYIEDDVGAKFEWILEACKESEERIVVFSVFANTVRALEEYLTSKGIKATSITGDKKSDERLKSKYDFIQGDAQVLIGTLGAMGVGFDGLQEVCRTCIMVDRDWSPEIMAQAEARLERSGQERVVRCVYLEYARSFDQKVGRINRHKAADIKAALEESADYEQ